MNEMEIQVESKVQNKNAPVKYADMETSPDENIHDDQNSSRITEPDNTEAQEVEEPKQTGGALWSAPKELEDIRSSMKELPHPPPEEKNEKKGPSLFDLVMEPPKKELQPTLFTYFDKLMSMGEV
ncbi:hypothetical protein TRFO_06867 [Tritrichomonas foetus]|uniref:Uncharacterized protein n=1 Tax=Tritrichomonas foetus TaxID=1144522 RepID=A0A1J4K113_9EUKA|nr:hypothetical protein TRFO_06867 [Tritrichomonas foetus]|eukprot:OHT03181.1 hypothetical protein TRFO_06867 [Tritrichomonas foetus]